MEAIGLFTMIWGYHASIATVLAGPVLFLGRNRIDLRKWVALALVIPFGVWTVLMLVNVAPKTLANLAEPFAFALSIPIAAYIRVAIGRNVSQDRCAATLLVLQIVAALLVYFLAPALPERPWSVHAN